MRKAVAVELPPTQYLYSAGTRYINGEWNRILNLLWVAFFVPALLPHPAKGQSITHQTYHHPQPHVAEAGAKILEVSPDDFRVIAVIDTGTILNHDFELLNFSPGKAVESLGLHGTPRSDYFGDAILSPDSSHIYLGVTTVIDNQNMFETDLYKLHIDGGVVWQKQIPSDHFSDINALLLLPNGDLLLAGYVINLEEGTGIDRMVARLDPDGNIIWRKILPGSSSEYFQSLAHGRNGQILIGGSGPANISSNSTKPTILSIDENGNELQSIQYTPPTTYAEFVSLQVDLEGNIYGIVKALESKLVKYAPTGQLQWERPCEYQSKIALDADGNIVQGGEYLDSHPNGIVIRKLTPEGDLVFEQTFLSSYEYYLHDLVICSDGGIAITGSQHVPDNPAWSGDALFVKFNCQGELVANANGCFAAPDPKDVKDLVMDHDLLLSGPVLNLPEGEPGVIEVFDLLGRKIASWSGLSNRNDGIDLSGLSENWYIYQLSSEGNGVKRGKIKLAD